MNDHKYPVASLGYQRALELIPSTRHYQDARLDLMLGLAENARRARDFEKCLETLHKVKMALDAGKYLDPILPARYWRRQADLMLDLKRDAEATRAKGEVIRIIERNFDYDSEHFQRNSRVYISGLIKAKQWQLVLDYLQSLFTRLPPEFKQNDDYDETFQNLRKEIHHLIGLNRLALARSYLLQLERIDTKPAETLDIWWRWLQKCIHSKQPNLLPPVTNSLRKLCERLEADPKAENLCATISCHALLARLYQEIFQPSKEEVEWKAIDAGVSKLAGTSSAAEYISMLDTLMKVLKAEEFRASSGTGILLRFVELTKQPKMQLSPDQTKQFDGFHFNSRCRLTSHYLRLDQPDKAADALASIDSAIVRRLHRNMRLVDLHVELGFAFLKQGQPDKARRHARAAQQLLGSRSTSDQAQHEEAVEAIGRLNNEILEKERATK